MKRRTILLAPWLLPFSVGTARAAACCGPIIANGARLARFLDESGVEHLWLAGRHIDWRSGIPDRPQPGGRQAATHCSAFVAAMADCLGIYLLRPPQHSQTLLANAQFRWLSNSGAAHGWKAIGTGRDAQTLADRGWFVVVAFANPDPHRPGHIAIVRPAYESTAKLTLDGPRIIQAGTRNYISTSMRVGFRHHRGAWEPDGSGAARFFAHEVARWPSGTTATDPPPVQPPAPASAPAPAVASH